MESKLEEDLKAMVGGGLSDLVIKALSEGLVQKGWVKQEVQDKIEWQFYNNDRKCFITVSDERAAKLNAQYFGHKRIRSRTSSRKESEWVENNDWASISREM